MTSDDVAKAVAKRLKFYLDTERREDAFDLSGPYRPERNQPALRPGSSLAYEGLHDRSLKHYYRQKNVKQQLQKMKTVDGLNGREKQVKKRIESTMEKYNYKSTPKRISPYARPQWINPKNAILPSQVDAYTRPRNPARKKSKNPSKVVGKVPKVGRRAPDEKVSAFEQQRLVNMATKLIVATETIALPQNRRSSKGNQTDSSERLPLVRDDMSVRRESSASDPGPRTTPHPPEKKRSQRNRSARPRRWNDSSSGETSLDSTMDSVRSQMQELKLNSSGSSLVVSEKDDRSPTTNQTDHADQETSTQTKLRPKSAGDKLSPNHTDSDYDDDFYDHASSQVSPLTSPRSAWTEQSPRQTVDSCTQTVENKGTQTAEGLEKKDDIIEAWLERKQTPSRDSSLDKSADPSTNAGTREEAAQTKRREVEGKVLAYEVFVVTGDKLGAGTNSDVKINLFGKFGDSGDRPLIRSKSNRNPFERKNVDLFMIDSIFLGKLTSIRIGHNGTALGTGWFLDRVVIREGEDSTRSFEFKCGRWLSARDDDGQIVRDLPLSATLSGNDVPKTSNASRTYFKYRRDSASSNEGMKVPFRPLSAKRDSDLTSEVTHEPKSSTSSIRATKQSGEQPERQYFTRDAEKSSSDDESEKEDDKNETEVNNLQSRVKESDNEAKEVDEIALAKRTVEAVIKAAQESSAEEIKNQAKEKAAREKAAEEIAAKDIEGNDSDTKDVQTKEAEDSAHEMTETRTKRRTKKRDKSKKERKTSDSENKKQHEYDRNDQGPEMSAVAKSPTNVDMEPNHDVTRDKVEEDDEEAHGKDESLPDPNASEIVKEGEIQATEEADIAEKAVDEENASNHSSDSESSSSDSELFSLSSESSSSDESEDETKKDGGSDDEEEIERVETDTSKKEDSIEEQRKKSAQQDYMAGFLAGVRASKDNVRKDSQEQTDSVLTRGASIHQACESGDFDRIKELINEVPELKKKPDERGWIPLHIVSAFGHLDILKWLTVNGINLTEETPTGFSAIHLAAMNGHVKCIMVLAAMGCPLGCRTVDESTPLHLAAMSGHVECVKWLLANRANHAVHDSNDRTPLDLAREYQHDACAELLELMENEMKRRDSIITKLRQPQLKDVEHDESSKGADNSVDSGEDAWISDAEEEVIGRGDRPASGRAKSGSFAAAKERRKSKQEQRADDEKEEKRKLYEKQQENMFKKKSSFLDSIRQEIDDGGDDSF